MIGAWIEWYITVDQKTGKRIFDVAAVLEQILSVQTCPLNVQFKKLKKLITSYL